MSHVLVAHLTFVLTMQFVAGDHTVILKFNHSPHNMMIMSRSTWNIFLVFMDIRNQIF